MPKVRPLKEESSGAEKTAWQQSHATEHSWIRGLLSRFPITQQYIGQIFYPQTAAEKSAGVTPTNFWVPPYNAKRYGTVEDGVADDAAALQSCINAAQIAGAPVIFSYNAQYRVKTTLSFKQGRNSTDTQSYFVWIQGNNSTLKPDTGVTAILITPRCLLSDVGTGRAIAPIYMQDIFIDGFYSTASTQAIQIGTNGVRWDSLSWSVVQNVTIQNFSGTYTNPLLILWEGRHCIFRGVNLRSGATCYIQATTNGSFVGDFVFESCEFSGSSTQRPLVIQSGASGTSGQARGIKFISCDIYGGGALLNSQAASSQVGDIWFTACQWDSASGSDIFLEISSSGGGQLFAVHVYDNYFVTGTQAMYIHCASPGDPMAQINVCGNNIGPLNVSASGGTCAIHGLNANGVLIHDNLFDKITGGATTSYVNMDTCTNIMLNNNNGTRSPAVVNGVSVGNASTNYSVIGNMMNCTTSIFNDYHTGVPVFQAANNLQV